MKRQLFAVPALILCSSTAWTHGPMGIHNPNPYQINGRADHPNLFINPYPPQLHNHYYDHFNNNPSVSPLYQHHHESPYSGQNLHGIGNPYTPYSTPNPYGTYSNPYAPDLFNNPYNPYTPGNIANPYGVYGRPYSINSPQIYNNPNSYYGNFINNPYSPNFPLPLYGPYDNPYPQNRLNGWQMNR